MNHNLYSFFALISVSAAVCSCQKEDVNFEKQVSVTVSMGDEPGWVSETKGTPVTSIESISDFGLTVMNGSSVHSSMDFIKATRSGSTWTLATDFRWRNKQTLQFYGLYPYAMSSARTVRGNLTTPTASKTTTFTYDVQKVESGSQPDILFGYYTGTGVINGENYQADMKFYHPLAGVQFIAGEDLNGVTLKAVGLMNAKTISTCTVDCSGSTPTFSWTSPTQLCDYYFLPDAAYTTGAVIGGDERTMMIIPQTLPSDAVLIVQTASNSYYASLSGKIFNAGTLYRFTLNHGGIVVSSVGGADYIPWE